MSAISLKMKYLIFVGLAVAHFGIVSAKYNKCGSESNESFIIPKGMDLAIFDKLFEGKSLTEVYFGTGFNNSIVMKTVARYNKLNQTTYQMLEVGVNDSNECQRFEKYWTSESDTAQFKNGLNKVAVFWSLCPHKYVLLFRCLGYTANENRCPRNYTAFNLYLPTFNRTAIIPWEAVVEDMQCTGITFGTEDLKWTISYGENENACLNSLGKSGR